MVKLGSRRSQQTLKEETANGARGDGENGQSKPETRLRTVL